MFASLVMSVAIGDAFNGRAFTGSGCAAKIAASTHARDCARHTTCS
jgi:hypothetical protein